MTAPERSPGGRVTLAGTSDLRRQNGGLRSAILQAVDNLLSEGSLILGPAGRAFESAFAAYTGTAHGIGVANGTDALEIALKAIGVKTGDLVALAANAGGYGSTALNAIGARPIYVEVDPLTASIDPDCLRRTLGRHPVRAVLLTHLYGQLAAVEDILSLADDHGIQVVEDCAQSHGALRGGKRAGSWGAASAFSFYPTKNLGALGDAGMVLTNDSATADRARRLRQYGWTTKYNSDMAGARNSRLDELQAAVLTLKLPHLDAWNQRRREIAAIYQHEVQHPEIVKPPQVGGDSVVHLYVIRTQRRESLSGHLERHGIPFGIHFPTPDYRQAGLCDHAPITPLPVTELLCQQVLTLPCFPEMTDDEVAGVARAINSW